MVTKKEQRRREAMGYRFMVIVILVIVAVLIGVVLAHLGQLGCGGYGCVG